MALRGRDGVVLELPLGGDGVRNYFCQDLG